MLSLESLVTFGKHKGHRLKQCIETDAQYWTWLREEKIKNERLNLLDEEADKALSAAARKKLTARVGIRSDGSPILKEELALQAQRDELYAEEWGEF